MQYLLKSTRQDHSNNPDGSEFHHYVNTVASHQVKYQAGNHANRGVHRWWVHHAQECGDLRTKSAVLMERDHYPLVKYEPLASSNSLADRSRSSERLRQATSSVSSRVFLDETVTFHFIALAHFGKISYRRYRQPKTDSITPETITVTFSAERTSITALYSSFKHALDPAGFFPN